MKWAEVLREVRPIKEFPNTTASAAPHSPHDGVTGPRSREFGLVSCRRGNRTPSHAIGFLRTENRLQSTNGANGCLRAHDRASSPVRMCA